MNGNFGFPLLNGAVTQNTQFRVVMPQRPDIISPIVLFGVKPYVKSKVSKHRVQRGHLVRFSGSITPRAADQQVAFQKKHNGQWVTVGGDTRLRAAASSPRTSGSAAAGPSACGPARRPVSTRRTSARRSRSRRSARDSQAACASGG